MASLAVVTSKECCACEFSVVKQEARLPVEGAGGEAPTDITHAGSLQFRAGTLLAGLPVSGSSMTKC